MSQKTISSLWWNLNYFLNKHEQVQEVLSKGFGGSQVTRGLDTIRPLHTADSAENKRLAGHEVPGKILCSRTRRKIKQASARHEPGAAAPDLKGGHELR